MLLGLKTFAQKLVRRCKADWDIVVAVTGEEGSGKSTFAVQLCRKIGQFRLGRNVLFSPRSDDIKKLITELPKYSPVLLDEAIKVLYKLNWNTKIQKVLNQFYTLCRQENQISILCIPIFTDLSPFYRNHRVKIWIHVLERGLACVFIKDTNPLVKRDDCWHLMETEKAFQKMNFNKMSTQTKLRNLAKNKCFIGYIKFKDLPPKISERYKKLKEIKKYEPSEEDKPESERMKIMRKTWVNAILYIKGITQWSGTKMARLLETSPGSIRKVLNDNRERMTKLELK